MIQFYRVCCLEMFRKKTNRMAISTDLAKSQKHTYSLGLTQFESKNRSNGPSTQHFNISKLKLLNHFVSISFINIISNGMRITRNDSHQTLFLRICYPWLFFRNINLWYQEEQMEFWFASIWSSDHLFDIQIENYGKIHIIELLSCNFE